MESRTRRESLSAARRAEVARVEMELAAAVRAYHEVADLAGHVDERRARRETVRALRKRRDALKKGK